MSKCISYIKSEDRCNSKHGSCPNKGKGLQCKSHGEAPEKSYDPSEEKYLNYFRSPVETINDF